MAPGPRPSEAAQVRERYARRATQDARYRLSNPSALAALQERQRATLRLLDDVGLSDFAPLRLLEVGSGDGGNLLDFIRWGFQPAHLAGIELLSERHEAAVARLPATVSLAQGDATAMPRCAALAPTSQDLVFQSTVFSSLLDDAFQQRLADVMWAAVRPGGGVLWYDFTVDNPRNPDVRGVPMARVRALFPHGRLVHRRITLAPPLARAACRVHPSLYTPLNLLPALRTHVLCWIAKPRP